MLWLHSTTQLFTTAHRDQLWGPSYASGLEERKRRQEGETEIEMQIKGNNLNRNKLESINLNRIKEVEGEKMVKRCTVD